MPHPIALDDAMELCEGVAAEAERPRDARDRCCYFGRGAKRVSQATGARLGLPWARPDCEHRTGLAAPDAKLCDDFLFSRPVFRTLKVFFVRHGSDFTFERDDQVAGRTVCAAADDDVSTLDSPERLWLKQEMLTLLRRPTLGQCLAALDRGEIEAVFSDDFVGQAELAQLGIGDHIEVVNRPVATRDFSAVASKSDPRGAELIHRLNDGLALLKATGRFADIVLKRLRRDQASSGESVLQ